MRKMFVITRSKKGFPVLCEEGQGMSNIGSARIICGPNGEKKRPLRRSSYTGGPHAWFVADVGDHVIDATWCNRESPPHTVKVWRIVGFDDDHAQVESVSTFSAGEWDVEPPEFLALAIEACKQKSRCYHCRETHYCECGDQREEERK